MKKSFLIWMIQLFTMPVLGQESDFRKNPVNVERGFFFSAEFSAGIAGKENIE